MVMLIRLIVVVISQCICVPKYLLVHIKYMQFWSIMPQPIWGVSGKQEGKKKKPRKQFDFEWLCGAGEIAQWLVQWVQFPVPKKTSSWMIMQHCYISCSFCLFIYLCIYLLFHVKTFMDWWARTVKYKRHIMPSPQNVNKLLEKWVKKIITRVDAEDSNHQNSFRESTVVLEKFHVRLHQKTGLTPKFHTY